MKKNLGLLILILLLAACAHINPQQAYTQSHDGQAVIIDVREADELKPGMIEGAKSFPLSKIQNDPNWKKEFLLQTEGKPIYLYCRTGKRAGNVQKILKDNGIHAESIGGIETLKNNLPITTPIKP